MKKLFTILGVIFAVIIAVIVIIAAIFIPHALKLDHEATAYIQDVVPKIVTNWNSQALVDRATPELLESGTHAEMDSLFTMFQKLGELKHLDEPQGMVTSSAFTGRGTVTIGNYKAQADFEKGKATIAIQLLRVNDTWKINGFHIYSNALFPPKT